MAYTWSEIGSKEMTNAYLYANIKKPSNLTDDILIRPELANGLKLEMDAVSFMRDGGGRFAYASNCSLIQNFMTDYLMPGTTLDLSLSEALAMFGGDKKFTVQQYEYNDSKTDRGFRTYVYGSTSFSIDDINNANKLRFIVTASGERRIENLRIRPVDDNFDFESDNPITAVGNGLILEKDIDPSGIGRTVEIKYTETSKDLLPIGTYTDTEYVRDRNKETAYHQTVDGLYNLLDEISNEASKLWANGTTKFIDPHGRAILYGSTTTDQLSGDAHSAFAYDSYMQEYYWANLQKGIAIVAGGGSDTLKGSAYEDYLNGGQGYDKYYANNGDTIVDSDGSGIIVFEGKVLHGVDVTMDSTIYPSNQDHTTYYSKVDHGTYYRNGNKGFSFVSDNGHWLNVFTPLDYTEKIIPKPGGGTMKDKTYRGVGVVLENFSSPLVLDLNHDGVTSLDLYATPAYFDMEKDGIREKTGWIQSTDALLAFDKNRDGIINDGSELFGNYTTLANGTKASNGFEALREYDENKDGVIDAKDNIYNTLSLWQDTDSDGVTDTGELHTLKELGVSSINLNYTQTTDYEEQNRIFQTSSFTTTDGTTQSINDVWFKSKIHKKAA